MRNKMNMKNKMHKCAPRNSQINLSAPYKHTPLISRFLTDLLRFSGTMLKIVSFCDKIQ